VSFVTAAQAAYRDTLSYVGTLESWVEANVGPQYISAYVRTVEVRPGDRVVRGGVVATLDCSNPIAWSGVANMEARATMAKQRALAAESERVRSMVPGGFVAINDAEQKTAASEAEHAQMLAAQQRLTSASLSVHDCILRAPFDGEVATRAIDPGAFVRPGEAIVSIVDRGVVRATADAPERDFPFIAEGTEVDVRALSLSTDFHAKISRRAPKADPRTRTVHFEVDIPDPGKILPVGTTGVIHLGVGAPRPASEIPIYAAQTDGDKASLFVVEGAVVHKRRIAVLGEVAGTLYLDPTQLPPGAAVVTEGRALLHDGDRVSPAADSKPTVDEATKQTRGAGSGRPL
jgi:RND family efflux transporter MFP subunit